MATRNDEPQLHSIFNSIIWAIDEETKENILHKWIKMNYNLKTDYTLVFQLLGSFFIDYFWDDLLES